MMGVWLLLLLFGTTVADTKAQGETVYRVNATYWNRNDPESVPAIFWFGRIDLTSNDVNGRIGYDEDKLWLAFHITDRLLRYDVTPSLDDITDWDALTVNLDLDGISGTAPGSNNYRFILQLNGFDASLKGSAGEWIIEDLPFTSISGWRGDGGMNDDAWDKGWVAQFEIPFTSLGLTAAPELGTTWGLSVQLHDRDETGLSIPTQTWPVSMDPDNPTSWGQLRFGIPVPPPAYSLDTETILIRQGLETFEVKDAHVGGHTNCGDPYGPTYWEGWGNANYAGYDQINIQNQWDIADWPCFSKYFVTFPLNTLPDNQVILSAELKMHLFGNSGGGQWGDPPNSYIQVLTLDSGWDENTVTWNNAPLAAENFGGTWVVPRDANPDPFWPGDPYTWDVTAALLQALQANEPLRLALYSGDGDYHTGKYFSSSDTDDWNAVARPTLIITFGTPCTAETCAHVFLPGIRR